MSACPRLQVLATSREPLSVAGEVLRQVPPLTVPGVDRPASIGELEGYDAVRLFLDRAWQRKPDFEPTTGNAAALAEVCTRLEGIPLAIELAAAQVRILPVEQISERLRYSFGLLSGGPRTASSRQRTMRATLDWSHELLSEAEKCLFRRLSVFAGGWTLEAAEAVGLEKGVEQDDVLDLLSGLTDKSLVQSDTTGGATPRYRMLEPIRQYAQSRLEKSDEAEDVRRRHAAFLTTLAEEAELQWWGPEEAVWLNHLEAEHDNMRAALSWSLGGGDPQLGLRLASALPRFWLVRGHVGEGTRWLEEALAKVAAESMLVERAKALRWLGLFLREQDELGRAEGHLEEALAIYERLENRAGVANVLDTLGWVLVRRGDSARATAIFERAVATAKESGDLGTVPGCLNGLAWIAADGGNFERARQLWDEGLALNREQGSATGVAMVLSNMAFGDIVLGNLRRATTLLEKSQVLSRQLDYKGFVAANLLNLGLAKTLDGDPGKGEILLKESLTVSAELDSDRHTARTVEGLALAAGALGEDTRGARLWGAAEAIRESAEAYWSPVERELYEPQRNAARSRIGEAVWKTAFAEGRAMKLEEAVQYALSEEETATPVPPVQDRSPADASPALTSREKEIAGLIAQGMTNRQIASELTISDHTATTHVRRILKKLGLSSRSQRAVRVAEQLSQSPESQP